MESKKQRPGVLIYFEIRKALTHLSNEQKGILFDAILSYGETGVDPDLDGLLAIAWVFIKNACDRDSERYNERCMKSKYAVYCRITKAKDPLAPVMSYVEWKESLGENNESEERKNNVASA